MYSCICIVGGYSVTMYVSMYVATYVVYQCVRI